MNLNIKEWKEFLVGEVFECSTTSALDINASVEGDIPYITRSAVNNGLTGRCGNDEKIVKGNCITIGAEGKVAFYQSEDFIPGVKIYTLRHPELNAINGMFIVTILNRSVYLYSYGRARVVEKLKSEVIRLPVTDKKTVDWKFMEDYILSLKHKPVTTAKKRVRAGLDTENWEEFKIGQIFNILNGKGITEEEILFNPGEFCAVQSGEENNGVMGQIDKDYCVAKKYTLTDKPCLTVARSGSAGFVSFHAQGCVVGDSAKILLLKDERHATKFVYLFLRTILMANKYKYTYGRKVTEEKYLNEKIKLPITRKNGEIQPDWSFMERYMQSLLYSDRI